MCESAVCIVISDVQWDRQMLRDRQREELLLQTKSVEKSEAEVERLRVVVQDLESRKSAVTLRQVLDLLHTYDMLPKCASSFIGIPHTYI